MGDKFRQVIKFFETTDNKIAEILKKYSERLLVTDEDYSKYFAKLCHVIIGQQLSGKVADVISDRFNNLFPKKNPTAEAIKKLDPQKLRDVGMAWSKVRAINDLADKTLSGELKFSDFKKMTPDEIIEHLLVVKGIGTWTVEMFLIFTLGYEDIFSIKDLGLKNGAIKLYGLKGKPRSIETKILKLSKKWSPYRSYASLALWASLDNR